MKSLENLAFFVRSCPIIIETSDKTKPPTFNLGRNYVYVANFDNGEADESIIRKALWYLSRQRYSSIGINDFVLSEEDKQTLGTIVPSSERPYPFKSYSYKRGFMVPLRVQPNNPVYLHPFESIRVWKGKLYPGGSIVGQEYDPLIKNIFIQWLNQKLPLEIKELFSDPLEDNARLNRMIGSQAYRVFRNKNISPEIKQIAKGINDSRKKQREEAVSVDDLEKAVRFLVGDMDWGGYHTQPTTGLVYDGCVGDWVLKEHREWVSNQSEAERAIKAIANAAYEIRQNYPRKGLEVRHGLVHAQAYRKLERIASQNADPEIVSRIIKIHVNGTNMQINKIDPNDPQRFLKEEWIFGNLGHAMFYSGALEGLFDIPHAQEDYEKIGRERVSQWQEGVIPYSLELNLMIRIMENYLSAKRFRDEVNKWLERHEREKVNWLEIKNEL
jgi:hypothetical protein